MPGLDLAASIIGELIPGIDQWRKTSHGPNPWTFEGLTNVLRLSGHMSTIVALLGGTPTSCFRCPEVNLAAGGVKDSYHQKGAALDVVGWNKRFATVDAAAAAVLAAAVRGELGPVREIIPEHRTGAVHTDWYVNGASGKPRLVQDSRY